MNKLSVFKNLSPKIITKILLKEVISDPDRKAKYDSMITADKYYHVQNEKINNKNRDYIDGGGKSYENKTAYNAKLASGFLRALIKQKSNYALGKPFLFEVIDKDEDKYINQEDSEYKKAWADFCQNSLYEMSHKISKNALNKGIGWAFVWVENKELKIKSVTPEEVIPVWKDSAHTELSCIVRKYSQVIYESETPETVNKAAYFDNESDFVFVEKDGELIIETDDSESNTIEGWGKIPFLFFKGNDDELALIDVLKSYIDAYDDLNSKTADGLMDDLDPILVLTSGSADINELIAARKTIKETRTALVDDGELTYLQVKADTTAIQTEKEDLRRDIYKVGCGVDFQDIRFGGNPNMLTLKSLYQDMDIDINELQIHFQNFIKQVKYFFDKWIIFTDRVTEDECKRYTISVEFNRDMLINEAEQIENAGKLKEAGLSQQSVLEYLPNTKDIRLEMLRKESEDIKQMDTFLKQRTDIDNMGKRENEDEI